MATTMNSRLLVEGKDEANVVGKLLKRRDFELPFEIAPKQGIHELLKSIPVEVKVSGRSVLGILADANDSPADRWQSIANQLKEAGCTVPRKLTSANSVLPGPRGIRIGVWLMPVNQRSGELDNFFHDMIPVNDPILPRARACIDGIPAEDRKFTEAKLARVHVHAWLAARENPRPMGTAIKAGDLGCNVQLTNSFVDWLRQLFRFWESGGVREVPGSCAAEAGCTRQGRGARHGVQDSQARGGTDTRNNTVAP